MAAVQGGRNRRRRLASEINVVPYIDVMLVLLVIFMVTAPLLTQGVDVDLPKAAAQPIPSSEEPVVLYVDANGRYFLDIGTKQKQPLSDDEVTSRVAAVLRNKPDTMILIKADKAVPYDRVALGMTLLQAAGTSKIGFVTDAPTPTKAGNRKHG